MSEHKLVSLNLNVRGMGLSATLALKEKCLQLRQHGQKVYDFGLGQSPFPVPSPVVEALRLAAPEKAYLPVRGLPALREAVAEFHRKRDHINAHPQRVLIGPGSKELMFLLQFCFYGEINLPTPCWVSYMPQARILGRRINLIHTSAQSHWKITAEQLLESLEIVNDHARPRLLVLNYPSNPTGATYASHELQEIAEVARKFELIILSDEIYGQLHYEGEHVSIAHFYPEGTIVSSGLSKWCGAGGWRLGTFSFPTDLNWLMEAMAAVASETYTSVSAPIQYAAIQAFHGSVEIEHYLLHARRILAGLADHGARLLNDSDIRVDPPAGAFYLFLNFSRLADQLAVRGITDGQTLCDRLLEEAGVAILAGVFFGRSRAELTARLSFVDFDGNKALAASERIPLHQRLPEEMLHNCCANVFEGVERIAEWVSTTAADVGT